MSTEQPAKQPTIINGNEVSKAYRVELKAQVEALKQQVAADIIPQLAVVLVGERKDSATYVNMKTKACEEVGILSKQINLPAEITEAELLSQVESLNNDANVNGILIQLPLPSHINSDLIINAISPHKDVDGLTATNAGEVMKYGDKATFIPCTPLGCLKLLDSLKLDLTGKNAVVIGRSILVGKPISLLLLSKNCTVTMCHSQTKNLPNVVLQADIVIAAVGKARFVKKSWLKDDAIVIDVGINAVDDATKKLGYRLVGDVDYDEVMNGYSDGQNQVSAITPVPGGVGPMTVTMLLHNTTKAFKVQHKLN